MEDEPQIVRWVWIAAAGASFAIAAIYFMSNVTPGTTGIQWLAEKVVHGACWVLLGLAALTKTRLTPLPQKLAIPFAMFAGGCYIAYLFSGFIR